VPSLWHDVLEKIKAAGLNTVSFHVPWALLEGEPGVFRAEGVFDLGEFFRAAREVGVWLVARPGPYIRGFSFFFFSLFWGGMLRGGRLVV
jgi:beta-galactosidase GanA